MLMSLSDFDRVQYAGYVFGVGIYFFSHFLEVVLECVVVSVDDEHDFA